jgi:DNA-binding NarL/FixJ family response regulator
MLIRVVVAEDNPLMREGVRQALSVQPDLELIAVCDDLPTLLAAVQESRPDVVLTDIRMPPTNTDEGIRAAERIRELSPATGVLVLSQYVEAEYAVALLDRGASGRGYLLKERISDLDHLAEAIQEVARGGSVIDPRVVEVLVAERARRRESALKELTPRELEVLAAVAQGKNNAAIAGALFLTERAVEKHINSIFSKLGLSEEHDINRRVKATLVYLSEQAG